MRFRLLRNFDGKVKEKLCIRHPVDELVGNNEQKCKQTEKINDRGLVFASQTCGHEGKQL